eukprot:gene31323-40698_t
MAYTSITVTNQYKKEVNIKIQGLGIGGCDIILAPGAVDSSDCWCLWGTLHYSFCAYDKLLADGIYGTATTTMNTNRTGSGTCPKLTGETALCSDVDSLGNCYGKAYACNIDSSGQCLCTAL